MSRGGINSRDLVALNRDLNMLSRETLPRIRPVFEAGAVELRTRWKANARATAGRHGHRYPDSITSETRLTLGGIYAEIGPDSSRPQGGMSFEYGSVNQPPHLDGQKAADEVVPLFERQLDAAIALLLRSADL